MSPAEALDACHVAWRRAVLWGHRLGAYWPAVTRAGRARRGRHRIEARRSARALADAVAIAEDRRQNARTAVSGALVAGGAGYLGDDRTPRIRAFDGTNPGETFPSALESRED